jgi:hypothetical protein
LRYTSFSSISMYAPCPAARGCSDRSGGLVAATLRQ